MNFGEVLKFLRKQNNITQHDLALQLNKGRSSIAGYEINNRLPEKESLLKISDFFNVSLEFLLKICEDDLSVTKLLGQYINERIGHRTRISSLNDLSVLGKMDLRRLLAIIEGLELPTIEEIKVLAIYGPFRYYDLIRNSIYFGIDKERLDDFEAEDDLCLMKKAVVHEIIYNPYPYYNEVINYYEQNKNCDYYSLIEKYVENLLHFNSLDENQNILKNIGLKYVQIDENRYSIVPLEIDQHDLVLDNSTNSNDLLKNIKPIINKLPKEGIEELKSFLEFLEHKYIK